MMKHKKAKSKKAKMHRLRAKRKGKAKAKKMSKIGGARGRLVTTEISAHPRTQFMQVDADDPALSKRVKRSLQNYKDGKTIGFNSVDDIWEFAESD